MSPSVFCPDQDGEPLEAETLCLPAVAASVPFARRMVARCLSAWDLDDLLFPCTQVVAELAANSVAEADAERTPKPQDRASKTFTVHLARTFSHLFVKVGDASPDPPKPRGATEQDESRPCENFRAVWPGDAGIELWACFHHLDPNDRQLWKHARDNDRMVPLPEPWRPRIRTRNQV